MSPRLGKLGYVAFVFVSSSCGVSIISCRLPRPRPMIGLLYCTGEGREENTTVTLQSTSLWHANTEIQFLNFIWVSLPDI